MSLTNNRLSVIMTPVQITNVKTAVLAIYTNMPFLIGLTPSERIKMAKIDVNNKVFAQDAQVAVENNTALLPAYLSPAESQKDLTLFDQLDEIVGLVAQVFEKVRDTQILAGSEAYTSALVAYRLFEAAAAAGLPGADAVYNQLKKRFVDNGTPAVPV